MENQSITLDFENISRKYGLDHIRNEFLMIDNLSDDEVQPDIDSHFVNYPVRMGYNTLFFCLEGSMTIRINLKEYRIERNDSLTVFTGSIMELIESSRDCKLAVIAFSGDYFSPIEHMGEFMSIGQMIFDNPKLHLDEAVMKECIDIYRKMKSKLNQPDNRFRRFAIKAYSYVLCSLALENIPAAPVAKLANTARPQNIYDRFIELVQNDFRRHRDIRHYADALHISPKYFSMIVKKVSGKTAGEWISEYVMLEAKTLLKTRRYNIQQVSDMLSFPNQSFFSKYFKAHQGCTPTQYQSSSD